MDPVIQPSRYFAAVTPNDGTDLAHETKALYIGGAGNVAIHDTVDNSVTFVGATAGSIIPVRTKRVLSTGTTATSIVALF